MPYKDPDKQREAMRKIMRKRAIREKREKQKLKEDKKEVSMAQKAFGDFLKQPSEKSVTELLKDAGDDKEKLLALYRAHMLKQNEIWKIPEEQRFHPYYLWVQTENRIRTALFDILVRRSEAFLGEFGYQVKEQ